MHGNTDQTRRDFIQSASFGIGALAFVPTSKAFAQSPTFRETADLIVGPFYPQKKPRESDFDMTMLRGHGRNAAGQAIRLSGRLLNVHGDPLPNRRIEIWQANANGRYSHASDPNTDLALDPDFQGYASISTDRDGRYVLSTIKPGPYRTPRGDMRAPHIHFEVHGVTTERRRSYSSRAKL